MPRLGAEYRPEVQECAECHVALVPALPAEEGDPDAKIVPVFRTTDPMILPLVKSLLESADIDYYVQGEEALGLWPIGNMASAVTLNQAKPRGHHSRQRRGCRLSA